MSHTLKKCDICTYVSTKTANVKRHMKRHDNPKLEPVGPLHCPDCDKTFEIKKYLTAHRKTHVEGLAKEKNKCRYERQCSTSYTKKCTKVVLLY